MDPQAVAFRFDALKAGPRELRGKSPIVVVARQGLTGAARQPEVVLQGGAVGGSLADLIMPPASEKAAVAPSEKFSIDHLMLIVDRSTSMRSQAFPGAGESKFSHLKELIGSLDRSIFPSTRISLVALSQRAEHILEDCGRRGTKTRAAVANLSHERGSNFDDSLQEAYRLFSEGPRSSRKAALFLTDGWNTGVRDRALGLARKVRGQNVAVFCVCIGAGYDLPYMLSITAEFGFSSWMHTPVPGRRSNVGKSIQRFFEEVQRAEHYLAVTGFDADIKSYGLTPAIKETSQGVYYVGYQSSGVAVGFAGSRDPNLRLQIKAFEGDTNGTSTEIPILERDAAATNFDDFRLARARFGALLVFLAQKEGDSAQLEGLKVQFPEMAELIDQLPPSRKRDDRSLNDSRSALSGLSGGFGFDQVNALSRVYDPQDSQGLGLPGPVELHSGAVGPLDMPPPSFIAPMKGPNPQAYQDLPPILGARLLISSGSDPMDFALNRIPQDGAIVVGRALTCDLVIDDREMSRQHFCISRRIDGFYIEDLGSTNGTLLNDAAVSSKQKLQDGDVIKVGQFAAVFCSS